MSELTPPVSLDDPGLQASHDYILTTAQDPDFDYPQVSVIFLLNILYVVQNCVSKGNNNYFYIISIIFANHKSFIFIYYNLYMKKYKMILIN